jgi:hypothetical protein
MTILLAIGIFGFGVMCGCLFMAILYHHEQGD